MPARRLTQNRRPPPSKSGLKSGRWPWSRARSACTIRSTSLLEGHFRLPPEFGLRLGGSPMSRSTSAGRTSAGSISTYFFQSSPDRGEREFHQPLDRVRLAGGDDVVVRLVLLEHQPHGPDVVAGEAPVALRVEVAEFEVLRQPELDAGDAVGHLARDELLPAPLALVVEQDAAAAVHVVAFAVVHRDPVAVDLRHAVRAARVERRRSPSAAPPAPCRTSRSTDAW